MNIKLPIQSQLTSGLWYTLKGAWAAETFSQFTKTTYRSSARVLRTPGIVIVLTTFIVNLRHMLYSASIAPHLAHLSRRWKWLLASLLTDEAYAVTITRYNQATTSAADSANKHWYLLGAGLALWWCLGTLRAAEDQAAAACCGALVGSLAASLIHSLGDFVWYIPACMSLTVITLACVCRLRQLAVPPPNSPRKPTTTV